MKKHQLFNPGSVFVALLFIAQTTFAAEFCVTSNTELRSALNAAESNSQSDIIKISEGLYHADGAPFLFFGESNWDMELSGGWTELFDNPCGQQLAVSPYNTVLNGDLMTGVLQIGTTGSTDIKISGLQLSQGFSTGSQFTQGAGLELIADDNSNITVENNAFINNTAGFGSAAHISGGHRITIRNNLFIANNSVSKNTVIALQEDGYGIYFTNNTLMFNEHEADFGGAGIAVYVSGTSQALIANNILFNNEDEDLSLSGSGNHYLYNNNIGKLTGTEPFATSNNTSLPQRFDSGILNFTPSEISPLVNMGTKPCFICPIPIPFDDNWSLGLTDMQGNLRITNGIVDIGAFESPYMPDLIFMSNNE